MHYSIIAQALCAMGAKLPQRKFMLQLLTLWPAVRGHFNYVNLGRYGPWHERTLRRWFGRGFEWFRLNQYLMPHLIPADHEVIAALDASFVPKSGKHTPGLGSFFNGSAGRAERGLEISLLCVVDVTAGAAYSLGARQTLPADQVTAEAAGKKQAAKKSTAQQASAKATRMNTYLEHVKAIRSALPARVRHLAVDGYFTTHKFVRGVCGEGLAVVGKLRRDANVRYLYRGPQTGRGRPRRYDGKVVWSQVDKRRWHYEGESEPGVRLYSASLYHVSLKRVLRVVLLLEVKSGKYALLYSTDLDLKAGDIVRFYRARFQIEFLFRDGKGAMGLADCQARNSQALDFHWNAALCALNLARWQETDRGAAPVFSASSYKLRSSNQHLLQVFSQRLGLDWMTIKSHPVFADLCNYGAIQP